MNNKEALIIVDVQKDFCPGGKLAVSEGDQVVDPINRLTWVARQRGMLIIVTRDWHPNKTSHFIEYGGLWPEHCVQGTEGAKFHPWLNIEGAVIISKGTGANEDAYSAFNGFSEEGEPLEDLLNRRRVGKIKLGGLALDFCDRSTGLDSVRKGFITTLMVDACRAVDLNPGDGEKAIQEMAEAGVKISTSQSVLKEWAV